MKKSISYLIAFLIIAFAAQLQAQATLSIQGIIRKSNGAAVDDGHYDLTFKLYNATSGGTALHAETQNINVVGGIYSAELGNGTPLTAAFDQTYYLGVSVDGGAELIPRARLTSSPYALSLLGSTNLFPGGGTVGVGTTSPTAGYQMHIANASGAGKLLLEGTDAAQVDFKKGSIAASVGFGSANNNFVVNPGANNTTLQHNGSTKLTVTSSGVDVAGTLTATSFSGGFSPSTMAVSSKLAVGQGSVDANNAFKVDGSSYFNGFVEMNGSGNMSLSGGRFFHSSGCSYDHLCVYGNGTFGFGLRVNNRIAANEFWAFSDRRIKADFHLSEGIADLGTLRKLRVTNYRHVDEIEHGHDLKKGFVAQEVRESFPEAVTFSSNFIPDVYELSSGTSFANGKLTVSTDKKHGFVKGDEVKIILPNDGEKRTVVDAVPSDNSFTIAWEQATAPEQVFVFGKKVDDFHTVDYDRIFTLNVSATQELARKVEALEKENAALRSELGTMKAENTGLKAAVEKFDVRLQTLENKLSN